MPDREPCPWCCNYSRNPHLKPCAIHPIGAPNPCPDFVVNWAAVPSEQWEPTGAAYYNGELILQPSQRMSLERKLELLDWHPLFTGRCPECEMPIPDEGDRVHWDCQSCGWVDDSV